MCVIVAPGAEALHDGVVDSDAALAEGVRSGGVRELARAITAIENSPTGAPGLLDALGSPDRPAHVLGITGAPGVGKSTMTSALVRAYRLREKRVAVIAVDPSSPFSGGALLGDRIRMQEHSGDPGVYIRSMASRGHLGGLNAAIGPVLRVCEVAGFDAVILETVGVGQSEVEVAAAADTTLVLIAPGMGDGIQAAKAGILEIGDIFVVNKADRDGASTTARELRHMIALGERLPQEWEPPVHMTVASTGDGIEDVVLAAGEHLQWLIDTGNLARRREVRAREEILDTASALVRAELLEDRRGVDSLASEVAGGRMTAFEAAQRLLEEGPPGRMDA
jgi:LAO/AO transport system kinase